MCSVRICAGDRPKVPAIDARACYATFLSYRLAVRTQVRRFPCSRSHRAAQVPHGLAEGERLQIISKTKCCRSDNESGGEGWDFFKGRDLSNPLRNFCPDLLRFVLYILDSKSGFHQLCSSKELRSLRIGKRILIDRRLHESPEH